MKRSGVVMEILPDGNVIVMTKGGEFLSIKPHKKVEIGDEATFTLEKTRSKQARAYTRNFRWIASVAAVFLLLFIGVPGFLNTSEEVAAYVSVDINPSVDLGISSQGNVVKITPLNIDGEKMISGIQSKLEDVSIEQATGLIFQEARKLGFLKPEGDILVTMTNVGKIVIPNKEWQEKIQQSIDVSLITLQTSPKIHEEAEKSGLSAGKYAVYVIAQNKGYDVTIDQLKEQSIHDILQNKPELRSAINQNVTKEEIDQKYKELQTKHEQEKQNQPIENKGKSEEKENKENKEQKENTQQKKEPKNDNQQDKSANEHQNKQATQQQEKVEQKKPSTKIEDRPKSKHQEERKSEKEDESDDEKENDFKGHNEKERESDDE